MRDNPVRSLPATVGLLWALLATGADAQTPHWTSARPDGHAPIGVMGDHTHERGEVMLSYRYMRMDMNGNRDGTNGLSTADVLGTFAVAPLKMPMQMHMAGLMYAPANRLTLMVMLPVLKYSMDLRTGSGVNFTTRSSGVGDLKTTALVTLYDANRAKVHVAAGASLPTGSIDAQDVTPASGGQKVRLPYPMQIASGTVDLLPGLTYLGQTDHWSWGAQGSGIIRTGKNDNQYRLGNVGSGTVWFARRWSQWLGPSVRVAGSTWGEVTGADPALTPAMVPTADPSLRGGTRLDALAGFNFEVARGGLKGQRLAVEAGFPVYQSLHGPQLETDWVITAGWQYAFQIY